VPSNTPRPFPSFPSRPSQPSRSSGSSGSSGSSASPGSPRTLLRQACLAALLALAAAPHVRAQAQPDPQAPAVRSYSIAPGPLAEALNRFAQQSGIYLGGMGAMTEGKSSPGLQGDFSVPAGLARLLSGSGYAAVPTGRDAYVLRPEPSAGGVTTLPEVTVTGALPESAWGPVPGYAALRSATASRTDTPIVEIPQSVSVVTRQAMAEQGTVNLADALRYTAGVGTAAYINGTGDAYDAFTVRGFTLDSSGLLQDGMRLKYNIFDAPSEPYAFERVEILKGPSSSLYGQSGPSGVINLVTKRPTAEPLHEIEAAYGSHDRKQLATDHSGALNEDGSLLYRVTALARDSGTFVDDGKDDRLFLAPALTWKPSARTSLTLLASYQDSHASYYSGGTTVNLGTAIPRSRYLGDPDVNYWDTVGKSAGYILDHAFNGALKYRQSLRYARSTLDYGYVYPGLLLGDGHTITRGTIRRHDDSETYVFDNSLQADWSLGGSRHVTVVGFDYGKSRYQSTRHTGPAPDLDLYRPVYGQGGLATPNVSVGPRTATEQVGAYFQQQSKFAGRWVLTLGGREDWARSSVGATAFAPSATLKDTVFTGRAGLTYLFDNGLAPYASYATAFMPNADTYFDGTPFKPTKARQYEVGVKYQPPGSDALVTLAAYELTQQDITTPDPDQANHPGGLVQTGEVRSRGVELEGAAALGARLRMRGSLTFIRPEITRSNTPGEVGLKLADMPERMASLWVDYAIAGGFADGLAVGLGARYASGSYNADNSYRTGSRTVFDAMASYRIDKWRLVLNVTNLFDRKYLNTCNTTLCWYGSPRAATLTASYSW